jgi:hypothetical protein
VAFCTGGTAATGRETTVGDIERFEEECGGGGREAVLDWGGG